MTRGRSMQGLPMSAADQSTRQLDQSVRQLISSIGQLTTLQRAALPQFYSLADLTKRWNCSGDQVLQHLRDHCGYVGQAGVKPSVSLDDVLRIDAALVASYEARKRVLAIGRQEVAHAS